jgi:hypothetical protein
MSPFNPVRVKYPADSAWNHLLMDHAQMISTGGNELAVAHPG